MGKGSHTCLVPAEGRIQVKSVEPPDEVFISNLLPCYNCAMIRRIYDMLLLQVPEFGPGNN